MADKARAARGEEASDNSAQERPDWLPEKFWDAKAGAPRVEEMAKSYSELERQRSSKSEEKDGDKQPTREDLKVDPDGEKPGDDKDGEGKNDAGEAAPLADLMGVANTEYQESGELTDDTIGKLEAAGIPRAQIDIYMQGLRAQEKSIFDTAYGAAGSEEGYKAMAAWMTANLPEDEIVAFNEALAGPGMVPAIKGMHARYQAESGDEPPLVNGDESSAAGEAFASKDEMIEAMNDPRYAKDEAYRNEVAAKTHRAKQAGNF